MGGALAVLLGCGLAPGMAHAEPVSLRHAGTVYNADRAMPSAPAPQAPTVLLVHGTLAHSRMELMRTLQQLLADEGVPSLAINLSLGISDRPRATLGCDGVVHRHRHTGAVDEIGLWLDWLAERGASRVVLLGHSRGGNQVAWFLSEHTHPSVTAGILVAPMTAAEPAGDPALVEQAKTALAEADEGATVILDDVPLLYCEAARASASTVLSYAQAEPRFHTPALLERIDVPLLVVAGGEDRIVPDLIEAVRPRAQTSETLELVVIDWADHFFRDLLAMDLVDAALEFLSRLPAPERAVRAD